MAPRPVPEIDPILCAAAELFEKRGYDDVSVEMIADRAGVGRSTAFARYLSKQGILIGIVQTFLYQFPLYLAQIELSAPAPGSPPPPPPSNRGRSRRHQTPPPISPPASVAAEPGPARLLMALQEFCKQWGAVARIALAAKDLPWVRRALGTQPVLFQNAIRLYLGPAAGNRVLCNVAADMLKHACPVGASSDPVEPVDDAFVVDLLSQVCTRGSAVAGASVAPSTPTPIPPLSSPRSGVPTGSRS